ncbi:MAG: transcriptional regulator [Actinophytocola sp.]
MQAALRLTQEAFAEHLGINLRTVAAWHQQPDMSPKAATQQILDTALERASDAERQRFAHLAGLVPAAEAGDHEEAERRLSEDPNVASALEWLDKHTGWTPGTARRRVAARLATVDLRELQDRGQRRSQVNQRQLADALNAYYAGHGEYGTYRATYDDHTITTSVLTRAEWLDLECELTPETDRLTLSTKPGELDPNIDELAADHAVTRLAEALTASVRVVDLPLYRLLDIDIRDVRIGGAVGMTTFAHYALTMDLLESELVDALAGGAAARPGTLPLRDRHLPDTASVVDVAGRLCVGGALALCAIARPAAPGRPADYLLLVQERSGRVLNAARRLAVTPKGFHQPLADYRNDTQLANTLTREMEEELFGREEVDSTNGDQVTADPLHPKRLTRPMRWLTKSPGRLRIEVTGFGLNLVSGNYECASLVMIDDEAFWERFGGHTEANWETGNLRRYSSQDRELLTDLLGDPAWSNEGLFALLQGLRRLAQLSPERVNVPSITWAVDQR